MSMSVAAMNTDPEDFDFCLVGEQEIVPTTTSHNPTLGYQTFCFESPQTYKNPKTSPVYSVELPNGKTIAWARRYSGEGSGALDKHVRSLTRSGSTGGCQTCQDRASKLYRICGSAGPLLFHQECNTVAPHTFYHRLRDQTKALCYQREGTSSTEYELILVTNRTFPPVEYTGPGGGTGPFYHLTIVPAQVTAVDLAGRMTALWSHVQYAARDRLAKFLTPPARASMRILDEIVHGRYYGVDPLERPDYWQPTCDWMMQIQTKFPQDFDHMKQQEIEELCVYAMATGQARGAVHFNFQTASNLLDFMVMETPQAIRNEMDKRSDPRFNQVSQLAQAKAAHGVINHYGVGLIWDGKVYRDDLDLHVETPWGKVWYNQKVLRSRRKLLGKLDFDAGINGNEDEPAENVTLDRSIAGQTVHIYIDNYTIRTQGDVHCSVIITQQGNEDIVIPVVWPKNRSKGNLLHVCSHQFTDIVKPDVTLSATKARAVVAQDPEFQKLFGIPTSVVGTMDDLADMQVEVQRLDVSWTPRLNNTPGSSARHTTAALSEFASIVATASQNTEHTSMKRKTFISERSTLRTLDELWQALAAGTVTDLSIHLPDHAPGYITKVTVGSSQALHHGVTSILSPCHFQDKSLHPLRPVKMGNARLDASWANTSKSPTGHASVVAMAQLAGKYFLVLDHARLPLSADFPLAAGFYPQDLSDVGYKHRSKWSFLNTTVPPILEGNATASIPLIGTFLTSDTATVFVNGEKMVLRTTVPA